MSKSILVTGATGNQGGAVVNALLALPNRSDYTILAVTRNASTPSAKKLASKAQNIKLVQGDQDDCEALFAEAKKQSPDGQIWGAYSVQISLGKGVTHDGEIRQGKDMVDAALKHGVKHFVYGSVDRGGDEISWEKETNVPHFQSKHLIEHHLRDKAGNGPMGWTVLRPVAYMDNLNPDFQSKVFLAAMKNQLGPKKIQWIATKDIGVFAAKAFASPDEYNHKALGLAGADLTVDEISAAFNKVAANPIGPTFGLLGSALTTMVTEVRLMLQWFATDGYGADIAKLRGLHPGLLDFETWIREESKFQAK